MVNFVKELFMRAIVIYFLGVLSFSSMLKATDAVFFEQACQAYKNKDFGQALQSFERITSKGASVWFNMGACCYHMHDELHALVYWKKAQSLTDRETYFACCQALQQLTSVAESKYKTFMYGMNSCALTLPLLGWQIIFIFFLFVLAFCIWGNYRIVCLLSSVCLVLVCCMFYAYHNLTRDIAFIVQQEVPLFAGPNEHFEKMGTLVQGQEVRILTSCRDWYQVEHKQAKGWIAHNSSKRLLSLI